MEVWKTILNIIIFILCLSTVVCIHEAGHLTVAKLCNVYCYEFSIGFGPRFFKHYFKHKVKAGEKDKDGNEIPLFKADGKPNKINGETVFSIRAFPLGGYVSMAGEDDDSNEDGISVPKERTLLGVNHFKQICIMLAGIAMNFLLAFVLFLCDYAFCTQKATDYSSPEITVSETLTVNSSNVISPSYQAGLRSGDKILTLYQQYDNLKDANNNIKSGLIFPKSTKETTLTSYLSLKPGSNSNRYSLDDYSTASIAYAVQDVINRQYITVDSQNKEYTLSTTGDFSEFSGLLATKDSTRTIYLSYLSKETSKVVTTSFATTSVLVNESDTISYYNMEKVGISSYIYDYKCTGTEAWGRAGSDFGNLFVGIYTAIGQLFTPSGWQSVGGIVSVYKMSSAGVTSGSLAYFLRLWGYISLNLGCFNLLPFPGLDGWQTLMALMESISRKKFSSKFKNTANTIGLIVLMVLAVLLIVKDFINPIN
jgi:RIP metalloprotease RseP